MKFDCFNNLRKTLTVFMKTQNVSGFRNLKKMYPNTAQE